MSDYKIKLEDKAAFLNRLEKQDVAVDSFDIKDNKLKGYFEFTVDDPQANEIIKTILKQSPKINKINEMQKKITKSQLAQIIREELDAAGVKKTLNEDLMQTAIQAGLDPATLKFIAGVLGSGAIATIVGAIANREKKAGGKPTMGGLSGSAPIVSDEEPLSENLLQQAVDSIQTIDPATLKFVLGTLGSGALATLVGAIANREKKKGGKPKMGSLSGAAGSEMK
jgi:hypothetical protein